MLTQTMHGQDNIHAWVCVCVCMCLFEGEREREEERADSKGESKVLWRWGQQNGFSTVIGLTNMCVCTYVLELEENRG